MRHAAKAHVHTHTKSLFCSTRLTYSRSIYFISRAQEGEMASFGHPIDLHYAIKGIDGWPLAD